MASATEDEVLSALEAGSLVYDQLRQRIGAHPAVLDSAIARLQASRQVVREGARIALVGVTAPAPARVAQAAAAPTGRTCKKCGEAKAAGEFYTSKDGKLSSWCRVCTRADVNARAQKSRATKSGKAKPVAKVKGKAKPAPVPKRTVMPAVEITSAPEPAPRVSAPKVALLSFLDGVRLGHIVTSPNGIVRMTDCIDLSEAQLDEVCREWLEFRNSAAGGPAETPPARAQEAVPTSGSTPAARGRGASR